jgi:hypothetical protein
MSNLPCQNQSCRSYGKPHPNCHCYGEMAKGGETGHFCDETRMHDKKCKYFADGGDATPTWDNTTATDNNSSSPAQNPTWENTTAIEEEPTWENTIGEHETPGQKALTAVEGAAQGFAGPLATAAELGLSKLGVPGISADEIKAREEENPWIHGASEAAGLGAGLFSGVGEAGLAASAAERFLPQGVNTFGRIGAGILKNIVSNAAVGAGDEIHKAMIGEGDPAHPVGAALANVGISGLLGGIFGGGLNAAAETNLGNKAASMLAGIGASASKVPLEAGAEPSTEALSNLIDRGLFDKDSFLSGYNGYDSLLNLTSKIGASNLAQKAAESSGVPFWLSFSLAEPAVKGAMSKAGEYTVPTVTKWLSEGAPSSLLPFLNYAGKINQGNKLINSSIDALFKEGTRTGLKNEHVKQSVNDLMDWIDEGGINGDLNQEQQNQEQDNTPHMAKGGEVNGTPSKQSKGIFGDEGLAQLYPTQNILLSSAKGRISNYLSSLKPQENPPKLSFDSKPDQTSQRRSYDKALKIAVQPLHVMSKIENGTLDSEDMQHFKALHPEVDNLLTQRLTKKISEAQLQDKKPSHTIQHGLSTFLGVPMASEFSGNNIAAAQAIFAQKPQEGQQQQPVTKNKRNTSTLTKSSQAYLTSTQANSMRQQKSD